MYIERRTTPMDRRAFEERARYKRSLAFHTGLARIVRVFKPR